jgi:protein SCO1
VGRQRSGEGESPTLIAKFDAEHRLGELGNRWHYLIGSPEELQGVWHSYGVYAEGASAASGTINHSTGVYLIDKQGDERGFVDLPTSAASLARTELKLAKS